MGANTQIQWATHTFNCWRGCTKVSDGCKFCYAETLSGRNPGTLGVWGPKGTRVVASEAMWKEPLKWNRAAQEAGERHRVFCASLADVFEGRETMPEASWQAVEAARLRLFDLIRQTPNLDWLLLTKRPENVLPQIEAAKDIVLSFIEGNPLAANFAKRAGLTVEGMGAVGGWCQRWLGGKPPTNVWLGTSVEDQKTADKRIPELQKIRATVLFLSCEPLLSEVHLRPHWNSCHQKDEDGVKDCWYEPDIGWVIVGGESGPNARPMHPDWARSLKMQCVAAHVPFFFKQAGQVLAKQLGTSDKKGANLDELPIDLRIREFPENAHDDSSAS